MTAGGHELSHLEFGAGPPLIILHGLFGSSRNWSMLAKRFSTAHRVFALDQRNHGASFWAPSMTYDEMANDVRRFIVRHHLQGTTVIGHSMGGKTAMQLALGHGELISRLLVADIAPVGYEHSFAPIVAAMRAVPLNTISRRAEAAEFLIDVVPEPAMRQFLVQNLLSVEGGLEWRINLQALATNVAQLVDFPKAEPGQAYQGPTLFLAGGRSDYLQPDHHAHIHRLFPKAQIDVIPGAGHWLHAEKPEPFAKRAEAFLIATK